MSFAEFSSLRQRKLNAQESAASTAAEVNASARDHPQTNQNPQEASAKRLQWSKNRGFSQIMLIFSLSSICLWGLYVGIPILLSKEQRRQDSITLLVDALRWLQWGGAVAAGIDAVVTLIFHVSNREVPQLLTIWDFVLSGSFVIAAALAGLRTAGCIALLRLCKVGLHLQIIDKEHADEVGLLSLQLRKAQSCERTAKNQLNQATTKWRLEVQTKERAELQLRQYKDEVMMLQEALVIASKDMAKMQVLAGVAEQEADTQLPPRSAAGDLTEPLGVDDLRTEATELLYAYIEDLGHAEVPLSDEDETTLVSLLVQASDTGIRTRIDKFMQSLDKPKTMRRKIIIREDGAFKQVS